MDLFFKHCAFALFPIIVFLFTHFLHVSHLINGIIDWSQDDLDKVQIYDYIIVGAGSAGSILASKLTDGGFRVLLVEAGGLPPFFADIPALLPLLQKSPYDWGYKTVPQKYSCRGLEGNQSFWPSGKVLGGSSRLNNMAYVEGHPHDYFTWFPDYKKYSIDDEYIEKTPRHCSELCGAVLEGFSSLNNRERKEIFGSGKFEKVKLTMRDGARWSTDKLLDEKVGRELFIINHAYVEKIIMKPGKNGNIAEGIEFTKWGETSRINAKNGVILSSGAVGTPKILMLSGIGPREHLEEIGIEVVDDLPVGKNLKDHILTGLDLIILNRSLSVSITELLKPTSAIDYFLHGRGPWTSAAIEVSGMMKIGTGNQENDSDGKPDVQFMVMPSGLSQDNGNWLRKIMGISHSVFEKYFAELSYKSVATIAPVLLHPKSSGEIRLKSPNPLDEPIINPNYLSHQDDVSTLISGIKFLEKLIETKSMKALGARFNRKPFPGCENFVFGTSEYWECYIRHLTLTSYHPVGTCSMGNVVDKSFRVYNTENLYIVDASVIPVLPSGNINAAVMMLAKKAAEILLGSSKMKCKMKDFVRYIFL